MEAEGEIIYLSHPVGSACSPRCLVPSDAEVYHAHSRASRLFTVDFNQKILVEARPSYVLSVLPKLYPLAHPCPRVLTYLPHSESWRQAEMEGVWASPVCPAALCHVGAVLQSCIQLTVFQGFSGQRSAIFSYWKTAQGWSHSMVLEF